MENIPLNPEQKDIVIQGASRLIEWLIGILGIIGGFLFRHVITVIKALEAKLDAVIAKWDAKFEEHRKQLNEIKEDSQEQLNEVKVNIAIIMTSLKPLETMAADIHSIKNQHAIDKHLIEEISAMKKMMGSVHV